ncbi:MAG: site-2 protease family protein [Planctomycetes bacterium]|jgi:regulator of sigma E protease|nr:site-2 protease family protein [Planctomycetota bacterium]
MSVALVVLVIGLLVLVHEAGHFAAALALKIPVARFSVGFGPALVRFRRGEVEYRIAAVPLGGYVLPKVARLEDYFAIPAGRRILFSLAGPAASVLLALPLFALYNVLAGGFSWQGVLVQPFVQTFGVLAGVAAAVPALFAQAGSLSGPLGVVSQGSRLVGVDVARALSFAAFLTVNFGVFNLLPVPVLDGGKIVLAVLEKIAPRSMRGYVPATVAGLVLLLALFVFATVNDVARIVS